MRQTVLISGGTGMVGQDLLPKICSQPIVERVFVLTRRKDVLPSHRKIEVVRGDVTRPDLGLQCDLKQSVAQATTTIIHGAAETSFSADLSAARAVNVAGTEHMMRFAAGCPRLKAFCQLSTVYVSGKRTGTIREEDLEHNFGFVNAYEQSKYEAEQLVTSQAQRLPATVVRLSTILGRSLDGAVTKSAAIHYALRLFFHSLAPMVPGTKESPVDLIASDYAAQSIALAAFEQFTPGSTWHICGGSDAFSLEQFLEETLQLFYKNRPAWRKRAIEKPAIVNLETFYLFVRSVEELGESVLKNSVAVLKSFAPQLAYPKLISDASTQHVLQRSGLARPEIRDYYPKVIRFLLENNWEATPQEQARL
jgi:nucleoside-diphosphate-sugar epimerase